VTLIHNYLYKEIILLTAAIIGVLTFLLVAVSMFKVLQTLMYTDLPMWLAAKLMFLGIPLTLTLTIPAGLLAAVMIVFGRMSSDRELLALKASGVGLAPIVAPVIIMACLLSALDYWLVAYVVPECQKEFNGMKHEIVTNNPMALLNPEEVVDKIPGWRIMFAKKEGFQLDDVFLWRLDDTTNQVTTSIRAKHAVVNLDLQNQQLVMTLLDEKDEDYPHSGEAMKVNIGGHGDQIPEVVSLNSFYDKVQRKLAWMTLPEIEDIIIAMQTAPTGEQALPHRISGADFVFHHGHYLRHRRDTAGDPDPAPRNIIRRADHVSHCLALLCPGCRRQGTESPCGHVSGTDHLGPQYSFRGGRLLSLLSREPAMRNGIPPQ
jgi:lipopolysaccharide export system permease protein